MNITSLYLVPGCLISSIRLCHTVCVLEGPARQLVQLPGDWVSCYSWPGSLGWLPYLVMSCHLKGKH